MCQQNALEAGGGGKTWRGLKRKSYTGKINRRKYEDSSLVGYDTMLTDVSEKLAVSVFRV
jgi:hypothetical protein